MTVPGLSATSSINSAKTSGRVNTSTQIQRAFEVIDNENIDSPKRIDICKSQTIQILARLGINISSDDLASKPSLLAEFREKKYLAKNYADLASILYTALKTDKISSLGIELRLEDDRNKFANQIEAAVQTLHKYQNVATKPEPARTRAIDLSQPLTTGIALPEISEAPNSYLIGNYIFPKIQNQQLPEKSRFSAKIIEEWPALCLAYTFFVQEAKVLPNYRDIQTIFKEISETTIGEASLKHLANFGIKIDNVAANIPDSRLQRHTTLENISNNKEAFKDAAKNPQQSQEDVDLKQQDCQNFPGGYIDKLEIHAQKLPEDVTKAITKINKKWRQLCLAHHVLTDLPTKQELKALVQQITKTNLPDKFAISYLTRHGLSYKYK